MSYQQIIYNRLRQNGLSEAGALGVLGNFEAESNCEPFRLQGDFSPYKTISKQYVADVTSGRISREQFAHDQKGFGLYQLTLASRKSGYWSFWKASGKALDSCELQVDYAVKELKTDFPALFTFLKQTTDIFTTCSRVCREFERPAVNNIDARFNYAKKFQHELDLNAWQSDEPEPTPEPKVDHSLKLRVTDEHCFGWAEAHLVQALLICRGYNLHVVTGVWDDEDVEAVKDFQRENGLEPDGIVGQKTWERLFNA